MQGFTTSLTVMGKVYDVQQRETFSLSPIIAMISLRHTWRPRQNSERFGTWITSIIIETAYPFGSGHTKCGDKAPPRC